MAEITVIKCDNPKCKVVGNSETESPSPRRRRPLAPPYGWYWVDAFGQGTGPFVKGIVACSILCIGPAVVEMLEQAIAKDNDWRND